VVLQKVRIWVMVRVMVGFFLKALVSCICLNFNGIEFQAGTLLTANDLVIYRLQSCEQTLDTKSVKEKQTSGETFPGKIL
jgi:hypothetical protein